jgi:GWxTD domain-containing protein
VVRVIAADGHAIVAAPAMQTTVGAGGGQIAASIDLAGLPPGSYTLDLTTGAGPDTATSAAAFRVSGFETARDLTQATAEPTDRFTDASEAQLDSMFEPLIYLAEHGELSVYHGLTVEGKQRFLRAFWRRRAPTPGTAVNETQESFYRRIAEANRRFREGGAAQVPGWRTDRGRVFIRYGDPDDVLREPQTGADRPWEAWKYTKIRALKFVFMDVTRLGNYTLIYSDDRLERNPDDWMQLLSRDALSEINSF